MKRILIPLLGMLLAAPAAAQLPAGRIYRSEFVTYDTREAAEARDRTGSSRYVPLRPAPFTASDGTIGLGQVIDVPPAWTDGAVYLHLENTGSPYTLLINGRLVAEVEDALTPADFYVSPFLKEGPNVVLLDLRDSRTPELQRGFIPAPAEPFANSYVLCQDKRSVVDFSAALVPDSTRRFGVLDLQIVVMNGFNYPEPVTVGYDLYDPTGKLLDFSINEVTVDGRSTDTVRFHPYVYHTYEHPWPGRNAPLYRLMLYTKRDGALREYIPVRLGFGTTGIEDGRLMLVLPELQNTTFRQPATQSSRTMGRIGRVEPYAELVQLRIQIRPYRAGGRKTDECRRTTAKTFLITTFHERHSSYLPMHRATVYVQRVVRVA